MLTRRDLLKASLATAAAMPFASPASVWAGAGQQPARIRGVRMALQSASFSFSGLALPDIFKTMQGLGLTEIDIMSEHIEHLLGAPGIQLPGSRPAGPVGAARRCAAAGAPPGPPPGTGTPPLRQRRRLREHPRRRRRAGRAEAWTRRSARRCGRGA